MKPFFVADIGNTRIKCALFKNERIEGFIIPDDEIPARAKLLEMCAQISQSGRDKLLSCPWTIAGVVPKVCDKFSAVLREAGFRVRVIDDYRELPVRVDVDRPEEVGLDRLLAACAVTHRLKPSGGAAIISAGTAVTIDLVDSAETFRGGVILPGFCMMAQALHDYTALLPMIESLDVPKDLPGRNTQSAILGGIGAAISGAIDRVVEQYRWTEPKIEAYLTGGDADKVVTRYCKPELHPILTLVGLTVVASGKS